MHLEDPIRALTKIAVRFIKLFVDRRPNRGAREFKFRWRVGSKQFHKIDVTAREGGFSTTIFLRKRSSDLPTFDQVFLAADYSFGHIARSPDIETLYHSLKKDGTPLILDLGANIGLSALYFSKNWPDCHVLAVEPDDDNDRMLQRNIAGHGNIRAIKAAVANKDGAVTIVNPDGTAWAYQTREVDEPTDSSIPSKSVPTLLKMAAPADKPCKPFVVKIDIEGFEENLFAQNADWIALFPIIWVELHDWLRPRSGLSHNFICQIAKGNWDILLVGENIACISNDPRWSAHMNALSRP